jgi:hypothetical protein
VTIGESAPCPCSKLCAARTRSCETDALGLNLASEIISQTVLQLEDAGYVQYSDVSYYHPSGAAFSGLQVTGRGLQVLGEWPQFAATISPSTLGEMVARLAEYAPADEAQEIRRAASVVSGMVRNAVFDAALGLGKAWAA